MDSTKLRNIRLFFAGFCAIAIFVLKPPTKDSFETSHGTVTSANQLINGQFNAQYSLDNGQVLKDSFKGSSFIQGDTNRQALLQLQGTNEKLTILHKGGKAWQIQKKNGEFILKFEDIQKRRYTFLAILIGVLLLGGIFLPSLVKK